MEENLTEECFFSLLDEASAAIRGDLLMEESGRFEYTIKREETKESEERDEVSSCHKCDACYSRRLYAESMVGSNASILFVLPYPEGDTLLSSASYAYYTKWIAAMGREMKDAALCALIKCPVKSFQKSSADICKDYLREEMKRIKPSSLVLLGKETAFYMLRRNSDSFDDLRLRTYHVNGIDTFCTYSPSDLVLDRSLRGKIWEDLKYIRDNSSRRNGS